jgi:serine/threonine-protein kinase
MAAVASDPRGRPARTIGRYALFDEIGRGGTATVHIGRLLGPVGFSKTVAIKRMHESLARDPDVAAMFLDEARLASRIQHSNAVATLDVLAIDGEAFLVMEYVHGESLASLLHTLRASGQAVPPAIAVQIMRDVLHGLHAAHEAKNERGEPLDLIHRDVSPHNILVGVDGIARVFDFGIAKAVGRLQDTRTGQLKGKVWYMAPEQLLGNALDRRVDVFAAALVLWESMTGRRPFDGESSARIMFQLVGEQAPPLSSVLPGLQPSISAAVAKAAALDPSARFATALQFARALEQGSPPLPPSAVGDWVRMVAGPTLVRRQERLQAIEAWSPGAPDISLEDLGCEPRSSRVPPAPVSLDGPTQSEVSVSAFADLVDSGLRPRPRGRWLRSKRVAVGAAVAAALSMGAFLAFGRGKAPQPGASAESTAYRPAAPSPSAVVAAPTATATFVGSPVLPAAEPTAPATAVEAAQSAPPAKTARPSKRGSTKHASTSPAVRRPEDLFSRE